MRFVRFAGVTFTTVVLTLVLVDAVLRAAMPVLPRFGDNFSAAYLSRTVGPARLSHRVVLVGDSVLWGYRLPASDTAAEELARAGVPVANLSFEGGSMVNTYALLRVMAARNIAPRAIVFNVNIKEFNAADSAYRTLYPAVETLAWEILTPAERRLLVPTRAHTTDATIDRALSRVWALYGMRSDLRGMLFGSTDATSAVQSLIGEASGRNARTEAAHRPTADRFLGTYDLSPLEPDNVEVVFLRKTVALLREMHVTGIAILTPTNHALLHDYIDVPEYGKQLQFLQRSLGPGIRVLDYDRLFSGAEFIDNDHLTAAGNRRLAHMLLPELRP